MARTRNERQIIGFASIGHALTHLYMLILPAMVLPLARDTGASISEVVQVAFPGYLLFGLGALPAGLLTDRWSARKMLALNLVGCGFAAALCGLCPTLGWLSVAHGLLGLFASVYHPSGLALISRAVRRPGSAMGINGMAGNLGQAAAPLLVGLLATGPGWRVAWWVLGIPGIVTGLWLALTRFDERPVEMAAGDSTVGGEDDADDSGPRPWSWFAILCGAMMLGGLAYQSTSLLLPAYFEARISFLDELVAPLSGVGAVGRGTVAATALATLAYLVGVLGQALGGRVADRFDLRKSYVLMHLCSLPFVAAMAATSELALLVCAIAYVFFSLGLQPVENTLVARLTPERLRSTAYGIKFTLTFGLGSLAVPAVAYMQRDLGLPAVFAGVSVLVLGIVSLALLLWRVSGTKLKRLI